MGDGNIDTGSWLSDFVAESGHVEAVVDDIENVPSDGFTIRPSTADEFSDTNDETTNHTSPSLGFLESAYVNHEDIRTEWADEEYIPQTVGYCDYLTPFISLDAMDRAIEDADTPLGKNGLRAASLFPKALTQLDKGYYHAFAAVGEVDRWVNREGAFGVSGVFGQVNNVSEGVGSGLSSFGASDSIVSAANFELASEAEQAASSKGVASENLNEEVSGFQNISRWGVRGAELFGVTSAIGLVRSYRNNPTIQSITDSINVHDDEKLGVMKKAGLGGVEPSTQYRNLSRAQKFKVWQVTTKNAWIRKKGWAVPAAVAISASGVIEKSQNLIGTGEYVLNSITGKEEGEQWVSGHARTNLGHLVNSSLGLGGAGILAKAYGQPFLPSDKSKLPKGVGHSKKTIAAFGLAWLASQFYADNVTIQQRVLPEFDEGLTSNSAFNPLNWDGDVVQTHTIGSRGAGFMVFASIWASLSPLEEMVAKTIGKPFKIGPELLALNAEDKSFIKKGTNPVTKGMRQVYTTFWSAKKGKGLGRLAYFSIFAGVGFFFGVGVNRAENMSQGFDDAESLTGTSTRQILTVPLSAAAGNFSLGSRGWASGIHIYTTNMLLPPINPGWEICSRSGEGIYQGVVLLTDKYENAETESEKSEIGTLLINLYYRTKSQPEQPTDERRKVLAELLRVGIDPDLEMKIARSRIFKDDESSTVPL